MLASTRRRLVADLDRVRQLAGKLEASAEVLHADAQCPGWEETLAELASYTGRLLTGHRRRCPRAPAHRRLRTAASQAWPHPTELKTAVLALSGTSRAMTSIAMNSPG